MNKKSIAIIGAGIAGSHLYNQLTPSFECTVFEKARGTGGRTSRRSIKDIGVFDCGAQFFTARTPEFQRALAPLIKNQSVYEWEAKLQYIENKEAQPAVASRRYVGRSSNILAKTWLDGALLKTQTRVISMEKSEDKWLLKAEDGQPLGKFDYVLNTAPIPQVQQLFDPHWQLPSMPAYEPCFCVMIALDSKIKLPADGAFVKDEILAWYANNNSKGRPAKHHLITIHGQGQWSKNFTHDRADNFQETLIKRFIELTNVPITIEDIIATSRHYWLYARPQEEFRTTHLYNEQLKLGVAGDVFLGGRIEGAFTSAHHLARQITPQ